MVSDFSFIQNVKYAFFTKILRFFFTSIVYEKLHLIQACTVELPVSECLKKCLHFYSS